LEVEKYEYKDQVNQLKNDVVDEKKNKNIIEELKSRCKTTGDNLFDSNDNLFAFNNGVYDFDKKTFRKIVPSDMITKSCGYDYSNKYTNKQILLSVLLNMFQSKELLDHFLLYLALSICYKNDTIYAFMIKWSKNYLYRLMINLVELVFGEYCCRVNKRNFFSTKIISSSDEMYLKTLRMVVIESVKYLSKNELNDLVIKNVRSVNTNNNESSMKINFSVICFHESDSDINDIVPDNINCIAMTNNQFINGDICGSDFFHLLIEYIDHYNNTTVVKTMRKKIDGYIATETICDTFIQLYLEKGEKNDQCKSSNIMTKYNAWIQEEIKNKRIEENKQPSRTKLYAVIKKQYDTYHKTLNFDDGSHTSGFNYMKFKN